jgi:hypothetical protein
MRLKIERRETETERVRHRRGSRDGDLLPLFFVRRKKFISKAFSTIKSHHEIFGFEVTNKSGEGVSIGHQGTAWDGSIFLCCFHSMEFHHTFFAIIRAIEHRCAI